MAKRVGNIYLPNCNYTCLYNAYRKAAKGKRYRGDVLQFTDNLEGNLLALLDDLKNHTYTVGAYREFYVYEPKKRLIMALPFRDRVAQWWVYSLLCIRPVSMGIQFVGLHIWSTHRTVRKSTSLRIKRRLKAAAKQYVAGNLTYERYNSTLQSYMGMMKHNDCYRFKMQLLEDVETIINESGVAA